MPKQLYEIRDFSGGLNCYADPRDIEDTQFSKNWNVVVDKDGILRIIGSAVNHINATHVNNNNFQKGFGLFQFNSDYSIGGELWESNFNTGIEIGTIEDYTDESNFTLQPNSTVSTEDDYYNGMTIFIYDGAGAGESRAISDYDYTGGEKEKLITVATAFSTTLHDKGDGNPSKYMIFRWVSDNWETSNPNKDYITNGSSIGLETSIQSINESDFFTVSKHSSADEASISMGSIKPINTGASNGLTFTPGKEYSLTFLMAAKDKWYNLVSDGVETGIEDTGITIDDADGTVGYASALDVDNGGSGTIGADLAAMQALILNREVYKSDGTFIGRCTAVTHSSSSDGTITFGDGLKVAVGNNTDLYVGGFGDKVPWVQLYSETITDTSTGVSTFSSIPSVSASWQSNQSHTYVSQTSSTLNGK